jgi:hypothetical protein
MENKGDIEQFVSMVALKYDKFIFYPIKFNSMWVVFRHRFYYLVLN